MTKQALKEALLNSKILSKSPFLNKIIVKNQPNESSKNYTEMVSSFYSKIKKN